MRRLIRRSVLKSVMCLLGLVAFNQVQAQEKQEEFNLGQVVVTATKTKHTLRDVPAEAEVITEKEIKARNIKTVQEALEYLTGVKVDKTCGSWGNKGNVEMLGLGPQHTLILVDGQRVLGGMNAVDLQQISTEMVERIEVVKGPASALYGSDAMGGVINIITKGAPKKPMASASTSFGSRGRQIHEVTAGTKKGKLGIFTDYTYRKSNGIHKEWDQYWEHIFHGSLQYDFTPNSKLTLKPYYSFHKMREHDRRQERFGLNSIWDWKPDELSKLRLRGSYFYYRHKSNPMYFGPLFPPHISHWTNHSYESEIDYSRLLFDRHTLTTGYEFWREDQDDKGKDFNKDQTIHSFFIQDEINLKPFTFVLGTRIDHHDKWGTQFNPKASLLYKVTDNFKLRGSIGRAFRGPTLVKLYADNWRMGPYLVHANPDLKPEKSIGYQLDAEYVFSRKLLVKLSLFRNDVKDLIDYRTVRHFYPWHAPKFPWDMYWENVDKAKTQGIELNLVSQIMDNLNANLGYTYLDTENKKTNKELTYRPRHKLTLMLNYKVPEIGLNVDLEGKYMGKRYDSDYNRLGGYTVFNLALTKDIGKHAQLFARADNILGRKNIPDEYDIDGTEFLGGLRVKF